ncbi:MAG: hypothetical protein QW304_02610 [Thermoproteota archaeon]
MRRSWALSYSIILSAVFSLSLLYSTLELPSILNRFMLEFFPDYGFAWEEAEQFINAVRPLSYFCLAATMTLIMLGFTLNKSKLSFLGSLTLFLPTFSYFAFTMFFLAGIGILRIIWLPFIELFPGASFYEKTYAASSFLELGDIVYLPYDAVRFLFTTTINEFAYSNGLDKILFQAIISVGATLFFASCATWFYTRFQGSGFAHLFIYKYSRHPQYLSFLIWSYGLLIYDKYVFTPPRGGYFAPPPLLWLISAFLLIGIALQEENFMVKKYGKEYDNYRFKTPFMLPLPKSIGEVLKSPLKLLFNKNYPEKKREILTVLTIYFLIILAASLLY